MTDAAPLGEIELEPIDPSTLRAAKGSTVWETVRGKRNRITIGRPQWLLSGDGLPEPIRAQIQHDYPPDRFTLAVLQLSLTLVPDHDCRFRSADLIMTLPSDTSLFAHLDPGAQTTTATVTKQGLQAALKFGAPMGGIEIDTPRRDTEVSRIETSIEAFGINTAEAGWRLTLTNAREIPLDTTGLRSTIVTPHVGGAQVSVNAVAEIDVNTIGDRWLTWAFKRRDATTSITYSIPA